MDLEPWSAYTRRVPFANLAFMLSVPEEDMLSEVKLASDHALRRNWPRTIVGKHTV